VDKVPRRLESLQALKRAGLLDQIPPREVVLDRDVQHLQICPDSQAVVKNCWRLQVAGIVFAFGWIAAAILFEKGSEPLSFLLPILSLVVSWAAQQIRKQFYYIHTTKDRDHDLENIPKKVWLDPM